MTLVLDRTERLRSMEQTLQQHAHTIAELAEKYEVDRATIYRDIEKLGTSEPLERDDTGRYFISTSSSGIKAGISAIQVDGYKSISHEQRIDIAPLTVLAGANSSGKSSIMQPLLLLKQTLEANYDPGALLLNGPNVKFTSANQLLSYINGKRHTDEFAVGIEVDADEMVSICFYREPNRGFGVEHMAYAKVGSDKEATIREGMSDDDIKAAYSSFSVFSSSLTSTLGGQNAKWIVVRDRCFLEARLKSPRLDSVSFSISPGASLRTCIREIIHLPGLRGNPERTYPMTAIGPVFPGTFEKYTASVILQWQKDECVTRLENLNDNLRKLGLTSKVSANPRDDAQVELLVGRPVRGFEDDTGSYVSIADVGFGVSQTLPILVALHIAKPGQLVYLEQPEIHLHPRAQTAMAEVLANAARRGVRVVVETHSALLLLGIQSLVAEGDLLPQLVKLHWFQLRDDGGTEISSAELDETGAFGDWPEDFAEVALQAESRYLDAVEMYWDNN